MPRILNRLWVRFSLSITTIILVITILPAASLLLLEPQDIVGEHTMYIKGLNNEVQLQLSTAQVDYLAQDLAYVAQQVYLNDVQFLTLTTLIVAVVAGGLLGRGLSLPIERLVTATKAIASQKLNHRVKVTGAQEIRDLADNFNQMTASLARSKQLRRNMMGRCLT